MADLRNGPRPVRLAPSYRHRRPVIRPGFLRRNAGALVQGSLAALIFTASGVVLALWWAGCTNLACT